MDNDLDILLINPNYWSEVFGKNTHVPCGLGFIARMLELNNYNYDVVDLNFEDPDLIFQKLEEHRPEYLGISMMSYRVEQSYEILTRAKELYPQLKIIVGGPHVIAAKQKIFDECAAIDIGCIGEGEETILEIMGGKPVEQISGIFYSKDNQTKTTAPRQFTKSIDHLPFPTYHKFKLDQYEEKMVLGSSRGCPYKCTFCGAPTFLGKKWRKRSSQGMLDELEYWYNRGYRHFYFEDSLFSASKKRIHDFCDQIIKLDLPITIDVHGVRADHMDEELLIKMKSAKFRTLTFGVESAVNRVLKEFKKGETIEQIEETLKIADRVGLRLGLFFIIGGPTESYSDVEESFKLAQRYKNTEYAYFFKLTPVPGTPYFEYASEKGYVDDSQKYPTGNFGFEDQAFIGNETMTPEEITKALKKARKIEKLIRNRFVVRMVFKNILKLRFMPGWIVEFFAYVFLNKLAFNIGRKIQNCIYILFGQYNSEY